jgi:hypothetical protein
MLKLLSRESNTLLVAGGALSAVFFGGGHYFSQRERYEREVEALTLQLRHEREMRELHE